MGLFDRRRRRPFSRRDDGAFDVALDTEVRGLLLALVGQVRDLLSTDRVHSVVAMSDDGPLAAAQLVMSEPIDGVAVAGVYYVGTLEAARGKGLGELVTGAVTNKGFDLGAGFASLQATDMGAPVYSRMGYELLTTYRGLVRF